MKARGVSVGLARGAHQTSQRSVQRQESCVAQLTVSAWRNDRAVESDGRCEQDECSGQVNPRRETPSPVHRMLKVMFGISPRDTETWLECNRRSIRQARTWVWNQEKTSCSHNIRLQCGKIWNDWLARDQDTTIFRLMSWRSAAHNAFVTSLAAIVDPRRSVWRRNRIGWPPRRWEVPPCTVVAPYCSSACDGSRDRCWC